MHSSIMFPNNNSIPELKNLPDSYQINNSSNNTIGAAEVTVRGTHEHALKQEQSSIIVKHNETGDERHNETIDENNLMDNSFVEVT